MIRQPRTARTTIARTAALATLLAAPLFVTGCGVNDGDEARTADKTPAAASLADKEPPTSRIVVVDESLSFERNLPAAAQIIQRFIKENAVSGSSEVYLVALDRAPHVIGYYPAEQLLDKSGSAVLQKITAPNPLDGTDVVGALRLSQEKLTKDNGTSPSRRYLLVFSDCYCDGQTHPRKEFPSLGQFAWSSVKDAEANFYFVADQNEPAITDLLRQAGVKGVVLDPVESAKVKPAEHIQDSEGSE